MKKTAYLIILSLFMTGCSAKPSDPNKLKADGKTIEGIVIGKKYDIHTMKAYKATAINFLQAMKEGNVKIAKSLLQEPDETIRYQLFYLPENSNKHYDNFKIFFYDFTSEEAKKRVRNYHSVATTNEGFMKREKKVYTYTDNKGKKQKLINDAQKSAKKYIDDTYIYYLCDIHIEGTDPTFKYRHNEKEAGYSISVANYKGALKVVEIFNQDYDDGRE